jgi:hypothetical protein
MLYETASLVTVMAVVIGTLSVWLSEEDEEESGSAEETSLEEETKLLRVRTVPGIPKTLRENVDPVPNYQPFHSKTLETPHSSTFQEFEAAPYSPVTSSLKSRVRSRTMSPDGESPTEASFTTTLVHTESADASTSLIGDSSSGYSSVNYTMDKLGNGDHEEEIHDFLACDRFLASEDVPPIQKISYARNSPEKSPSSFHSIASPVREYKTNRSALKEKTSPPSSSLETLINQDVVSNVNLRCHEVDLSQRPLQYLSESLLLRLVHVSYLDLSHTQLSSLPDSFGALVHLQHFIISSNNLVGLPSSFGNLTSLVHLDLSKNKISSLSKLSFFCVL